jgi:hypothetical protein
MQSRDHVAAALATALLGGPWVRAAMLARSRTALGRQVGPRWLGELVGQVLGAYRDAPADRPRELAGFVLNCAAFAKAWEHRRVPRIVHWTPAPTAIVRRPWPIAELADHAALARLLDLDQGELAWFADVRSLEARVPEPLRHYRWTAVDSRSGTRLIAAPKPRLKEIQRRILRHVLDPIAIHDAAHGSVRGRSVRSAVAPHAAAAVVIRVDLEAFFPSIPAGRIWSLFRLAGLPEGVAHTLTGLATTVVPAEMLRGQDPLVRTEAIARLRVPHLPTGAPTSPALANLIAFSLDRRLAGLAARFDARYTRYVDDLTFSGGAALTSQRSRFVALVERIVRAEGFAVNDRKTVVLRSSGRQALLGAVINERATIPRPERDALRALLHNCAVRGWRSQARGRADFQEHVLGRISWVAGLDPSFGARLRAAYDRIDWT